jgi:tetratricopeptide (TPR) repeat protein
MERILLDRLKFLQERQSGVDLDVGEALLDLEGFYGGTGRDQQSEQMAKRAIEFYSACKGTSTLHNTCDRFLADAQGMLGAMFFNRKLYDRADPWLRKVVDRPDYGARPELLFSCLVEYATILRSRGASEAASAALARAERVAKSYPGTNNPR